MATAAQIAKKHNKQVLDSIDEALEDIQNKLRKYDALIEERGRLTAARRAMLNDRAVAQGGGKGLSQSEVIRYLAEHPGSTVSAIASGLSTTESVVRGHLNRGKDERFRVESEDGVKKWSLRTPSEDDEEDDDEDE